ncbi:MAG: hypothetical protein HS108_02980 [Planctomycetes bacterium]|nr:hypothetical protein [Planctomycetota bacterium]
MATSTRIATVGRNTQVISADHRRQVQLRVAYGDSSAISQNYNKIHMGHAATGRGNRIQRDCLGQRPSTSGGTPTACLKRAAVYRHAGKMLLTDGS